MGKGGAGIAPVCLGVGQQFVALAKSEEKGFLLKKLFGLLPLKGRRWRRLFALLCCCVTRVATNLPCPAFLNSLLFLRLNGRLIIVVIVKVVMRQGVHFA